MVGRGGPYEWTSDPSLEGREKMCAEAGGWRITQRTRSLSVSGAWPRVRPWNLEVTGEMGLAERLRIAWNYQMEDFNIDY